MTVLCGLGALRSLQQLLAWQVAVKVFSENTRPAAEDSPVACLVQSGEGPVLQRRWVFWESVLLGQRSALGPASNTLRTTDKCLIFGKKSSSALQCMIESQTSLLGDAAMLDLQSELARGY